MRRSIVALAIAAALSALPQAQRVDVRVRVLDLDSDAPILRAQLSSASTDPLPPTFSDEHGLAALTVPAAGRTIRVSKPGYLSRSLNLTTASDAIDVKLARGAAINGRIVDTLGAPVVGRPVLVTSSAQRNQQPQTVRTDDRGEYRIGTLPDGTYTVSLNAIPSAAPGAGPPIPDALPHTVVLRRGEEVGGIDFTITSRSTCRPPPAFGLVGNASVFSTIAGRVTAMDGTPLGCVEVVASRGGSGPVTSAITAADGRYALQRLRAGTYRIEFTRPGYVTVQWGQVDSGQPGRQLALRDREILQRIDMSMSRGGAITGTLTDEFGEPVENVKVRALQLRGDDERAIAIGTLSAPTDDRGRYRLFALLPGRYIVATEATADPPD